MIKQGHVNHFSIPFLFIFCQISGPLDLLQPLRSDSGHGVLSPRSKSSTHTHTFKPVAVQVVVQLPGDHMGWQMASYQAAQRLIERIRSNQS